MEGIGEDNGERQGSEDRSRRRIACEVGGEGQKKRGGGNGECLYQGYRGVPENLHLDVA